MSLERCGLSSTGDAEFNIAIGNQSLMKLMNGTHNTVIGHKAGLNINTAGTGGTNNVIIGFNAGAEIEGGEYNICIGNFSGPDVSVDSQQSGILSIDTNRQTSSGRGPNSLIYGKQQASTSSTNDTLSLNADVTINNLDGISNGDLSTVVL